MKVALCTPVHSDTKTLFTFSLLAMAVHTMKERRDIELQGHLHHKCSRIEEARNKLADAALSGGAKAILWLDADQTFPPDTLLRLLAHDLPFIGCNIRKRVPGEVVSASHHLRDGKPVQVEPKAKGAEQVDLLGFGVVLTKAEIFMHLPRPWFQSGPYGEDGYFCQHAAAHGFLPHVDHALSMEVGHIAETVLRFPR